MTDRFLLQRTIDMAEARRGSGRVGFGEPVPTGRSRQDGLAQYLVGDGYAYADPPQRVDSEIYLAADSVGFASFVQRLRLRGRVLELGSGSGVVSARLARTCAHVTAVDNSAEAVRASRATLRGESSPARFDVVHGDLFEVLEKTDPVDAVVANLPFVPVPDGVAYRGYGAGGPTGLGVVERVLEILPGHLTRRSTVCLKLHCALADGPLVAGPLRRFLARVGHAACLVIDGDVPMGFRAGQSALNAADLNPGRPDLLEVFDRHYADLGDTFASMVIVTAPADADGMRDPGTLKVVDQRPMPSWSVSAPPTSLPRVLRRYGVLTARMPEGYSELGTAAMVDEVAVHAQDVLRVAADGGSLLRCAYEALPGVAEMDPVRARGYVVPVAQLRRAARMEFA